MIQYGCGDKQKTNQIFTLLEQPGGYWAIRAEHSKMCLEVLMKWNGENVRQYACNGLNYQQFSIEAFQGSYVIKPKLTPGGCLDVSGGSKRKGANINQWPCTKAPNQSFALENF